ncbi:HI1506-related protein [Comamonas aquatica]|uniref:HI1506-related protein n=1 Tax=Comamonas aquatica TaxID=225991 RepID=UPI002446F3C5|nr:HI1506-related protein [Comamonas aquatica]MDH0494251.1 HI1506-related protein [Comamonas aquatica]
MSTPKKAAAPKAKAATRPAGPATEAIKVVPKRAGFRRAGYAFPEEGQTIALSELSEEQLQQLEAEPMLVTSRVTVAGQAEGPAAPASE